MDVYGILTIVRDESGSAYTIVLVRENGTEIELAASKRNPNADGALSNAICRSWKIVKSRYYAKENGRKLFDFTGSTPEELYNQLWEFATKHDPELMRVSGGAMKKKGRNLLA